MTASGIAMIMKGMTRDTVQTLCYETPADIEYGRVCERICERARQHRLGAQVVVLKKNADEIVAALESQGFDVATTMPPNLGRARQGFCTMLNIDWRRG